MSATQATEPNDADWAAAKSILPCGKLSGDDPDDVSALAYRFAEHRVKCSRGLPTAALDGRTAGDDLRAIKAKFDAMKATAYKLPNKCECSGSEACVCCNLLAEIGDIEEALSSLGDPAK